ncbi:MAG: cytoplasmic protein [Pseudomonadota bacterium]|nr:cytoplasmic protein [Pseudomonadota bacterium]
MTTLAVDKPRAYELGDVNELPVVAADIIYEGAAVGDNGSGIARPLVAGDPFRGFAVENVDNSAGAASDKTVKVKKEGELVLPITSLAITDVGKPVYASDDDTFTLTAGSNSHIGRVVRWIATGSGVIAFSAVRGAAGLITPLTDNSGGTASNTLAAIEGTYTEATIENTVASLAAKVNALIAMQK